MQVLNVSKFGRQHRSQRSHRQRRRRHIVDGQCLAARRALTAAHFYLAKGAPTIAEAAISCGSSVSYVRAAIILLKSENPALIDRVLRGARSLPNAAREVHRIVQLVHLFRLSTPAELAVCGKTVGAEVVFDRVVVPAV